MRRVSEKKKRLLPSDPLEALEAFNSMLNKFQRTVNLIDGKLGQMDNAANKIDKRFTSLTPPASVSKAKPKPHSHEPYTGKLDHCIQCAVKHSQTAKVLAREALQRAEADSPSDMGVQAKIRGVVEELSGLEDDTDTVAKGEDADKVRQLNATGRTLRKHIYATRAEIGGADLETLKEIKGMVDQLVDATYRVRKSCVACTVEELCGGNLECVEFLEKAYKRVKSVEEFQEFISEARARYGK